MSLQEQQNFLARIFTDESLRLNFLAEPEKIGGANGLREEDIAWLREIIPDELNFFANSLFHKRLHQVEKLLPLSKKALGKDFATQFQKFSQTFQPITVKKHVEDAIEFCKLLQSQPVEPLSAKSTAKFEQTKHEFFSYRKRLAFCFLNYDVFTLKQKIGFAIWYRIGKNTRHFIL